MTPSENRADDPGVGTAEKPHTPERPRRLSRVTPQSKLSADSSSTSVTANAPREERLGGAAGPFRGGSAASRSGCCACWPNNRISDAARARAGRRSAVRGYAIDQESPADGDNLSPALPKACHPVCLSINEALRTCSRGRRQRGRACRNFAKPRASDASEPAPGEPFDQISHQAMFEVDGSESARHHRRRWFLPGYAYHETADPFRFGRGCQISSRRPACAIPIQLGASRNLWTRVSFFGQASIAAQAMDRRSRPPIAYDCDGTADDGVSSYFTRGTPLDQRLPRDKLAALRSVRAEYGADRALEAATQSGRRYENGDAAGAAPRSQRRCGESGLTFTVVALFHGSISRSRAAATSAPRNSGCGPCGDRTLPTPYPPDKMICPARSASAGSSSQRIPLGAKWIRTLGPHP